MGYESYFRDLLGPMRVYDLTGGIGAGEFSASGSELDKLDGSINITERECVVGTAESFGLEAYEKLLPLKPLYRDLETRRAAINALIAIDDTSFTPQAVNRALAGCGISALAEETGEWYKVKITFPGIKGVPDNMERLMERIEAILPCHIDCEYVFSFFTWNELEAAALSWDGIEAGVTSFDELEKYDVTDIA